MCIRVNNFKCGVGKKKSPLIYLSCNRRDSDVIRVIRQRNWGEYTIIRSQSMGHSTTLNWYPVNRLAFFGWIVARPGECPTCKAFNGIDTLSDHDTQTMNEANYFYCLKQKLWISIIQVVFCKALRSLQPHTNQVITNWMDIFAAAYLDDSLIYSWNRMQRFDPLNFV